MMRPKLLILIIIIFIAKIYNTQNTCDFYANQTGVMLQNYTNNYYNTLKPK